MEFAKIRKYKKIIKFVYQDIPRGTGDAVLKCKNYIRSKYFLMLLPDDLIIKNNCSQSMIKLHKKYKSSIIASKKVKKKDVSRWGIFNLKKFNKKNFFIKFISCVPGTPLVLNKGCVVYDILFRSFNVL